MNIFIAEVLPNQKLEKLKHLQSKGENGLREEKEI